jgi:formate hydrogenlyase subunit 4
VLSCAPVVSLSATLCAAALVPSFTLDTVLAPLADGLVIASLLSLARVATTLGALDTGSAPAGIAAQHSSTLAILSEPALLLLVFSLALMGGGFNLNLIIGEQHDGMLLPQAASALALTSLLGLVVADVSDNSAALELDHSGIDLAMCRVTVWLRRLVWIDLIGALFLPVGIAGVDGGLLDWGVGLLCWAAKLMTAIICLAAVRALLARVSRREMPNLVGLAVLLALLATIVVLASTVTA